MNQHWRCPPVGSSALQRGVEGPAIFPQEVGNVLPAVCHAVGKWHDLNSPTKRKSTEK